MCFDLLYNFERFLILKAVDRNLIKMYIGLHVKFPLFLGYFNKSWFSWIDFLKILKNQISW